jgi:dolichyl-phosphate beta-glucosyltransferase
MPTMLTTPTIIVVPCYNEARRFDGDAFITFAQQHDEIGFLFVNDGSTDDTAAVLMACCERDPDHLACIDLDRNMGKAEAVRDGMQRAMQESACTFAGYWDADLATPLDEIPRFIDTLQQDDELEFALGSRIRLLGRAVRRNPQRHYLGRIFATFTAMILGLAVYDTQCGAKLLRVNDRTRSIFEEPFISRWVFDVELLARFISHVKRKDPDASAERHLVEIPLRRWVDVHGSKLGLSGMFSAGRDLLRIRSHYRR